MSLLRRTLPLLLAFAALPLAAGEEFFGYLKGADTLPKATSETYLWLTQRSDKGAGHYRATNLELEYEYGFSPKFTGNAALKGQSIDTSGLVIDGYLPGAESYSMRASGVELGMKYNFLPAAIAPVGVSAAFSLEHSWLDPHSGRDKKTTSASSDLLLQKYFLDDQLITVANVGLESTYAVRDEISDLPEGFDWPTTPEMEIELTGGAGVMYRFAPRWFAGAETFYQTEFETEIGQERWSWQGGPSLHYANRFWWATATWMPQLRGGGEQYVGQRDTDLHLIEKTKQEFRVKIGVTF